LRWWRVRVEKARGLTDRAIAAKLVMTEDHVSRLLRARAPAPAASAAKPTDQLSLFGQ
jgi:transcriptional regulator with XRE-family HTH domain